jgi:hypothetical protein
MKHISERRSTRRRGLGSLAKAVLATVGAAAVVTGVGVSTASASVTSSDAYTFEAFRETIKPWDSIRIPSLTCPQNSWLKGVDFSPGRYVPNGFEVTGDADAIGTTITGLETEYVTDWRGIQHRLVTGSTDSRGVSTATNWDLFTSHELVINLHCTMNISEAATPR